MALVCRAMENGQFFIDKKEANSQGLSLSPVCTHSHTFEHTLPFQSCIHSLIQPSFIIDFYFEKMSHTKAVKKEKRVYCTFRSLATDRYLSRPSCALSLSLSHIRTLKNIHTHFFFSVTLIHSIFFSIILFIYYLSYTSPAGPLIASKKERTNCFVDAATNVWKIYHKDLTEGEPPYIGMHTQTHVLCLPSNPPTSEVVPILLTLDGVSDSKEFCVSFCVYSIVF